MKRPNFDPTSPAASRYISTAEVAQVLGVSVTTVKRWVDDGVLPAKRTAGGHRKLLQNDVLRLVREQNLPHADISKLIPALASHSSINLTEFAHQFRKATDSGDVDLIRTLIHSGHRNGLGFEVLADQVIAPALHSIGNGWVAGKVEVLDEHRVTQACIAALHELRGHLQSGEQERPVAVGGAPENDHYTLPTLLTELTLLSCGWNAINLGSHTPISALRSALDQFKPRLIWISATYLAHPEQFLAEYEPFYRETQARGVAVAIGGQAFGEQVRKKMAYTSYGDSLTQLAALVRSLHPNRTPPKRGRPPRVNSQRERQGHRDMNELHEST